MVGWLDGWMVGWLVGWLVGWFWLVFVFWLVGWSVCWLVGWVDALMVGMGGMMIMFFYLMSVTVASVSP